MGALKGPDPGFFVALWNGSLVSVAVTALDAAVGTTNVRTIVVVIELCTKVVVVTVVAIFPLTTCVGTMPSVLLSPEVPKIVREPIIVDTKVRGGIVVVNTEVMVSGESRV